MPYFPSSAARIYTFDDDIVDKVTGVAGTGTGTLSFVGARAGTNGSALSRALNASINTGYSAGDSRFSFAAWVYCTTTANWTVVGSRIPGGTGNSRNWELRVGTFQGDAKVFCSAYRSNTTGAEVRGTSAVPINTWIHLAAVFDGATLFVYYNGTVLGSVANTTYTFDTGASPLTIGGRPGGGLTSSASYMDDAIYYPRALTAKQINNIYLNRYPPKVIATVTV